MDFDDLLNWAKKSGLSSNNSKKTNPIVSFCTFLPSNMIIVLKTILNIIKSLLSYRKPSVQISVLRKDAHYFLPNFLSFISVNK